MPRTFLLPASFLGSLAVVFLERGIYFFTRARFDFSEAANLWLGLLLGVCYVIGALLSHGVARRVGERRLMALTIAGQIAAMLALCASPRPLMVWLMFTPFGLLSGAMWPVIESYVTAGLAGERMRAAVGRFCIAWSLAVPVALAASGPMIASRRPASLFLAAAGCHLAAGLLLRRLAARPAHLAHDDPRQPDPQRMARYQSLMVSARWSMLATYVLLFLLAPLMPHILSDKLKLTTAVATPIASLVDAARVAAFILLSGMTGWYGRSGPLGASIVLMPAGFTMVLFGPNVAWVIAGEILFGLVSGMVYYAALYYALALKNSAVEAGGAHEALIGAGFALGPMCGLIGLGLTHVTGDYVQGMLLGVAPLTAVCLIAAARPLIVLRRSPVSTDG